MPQLLSHSFSLFFSSLSHSHSFIHSTPISPDPRSAHLLIQRIHLSLPSTLILNTTNQQPIHHVWYRKETQTIRYTQTPVLKNDPFIKRILSPPSPSSIETQLQAPLLTSSQEHYVKKYLLTVLINNELARLQKDPYETLPNLGGPFDLKDEHANSTTPFLRYLFESIVVPFPFLTNSRGALWPKLQLFMDEYAKIEAGNGVEREEMLRRKRLQNKGEKTLVLMYSMAIKTVEQRALEKRDLAARKERLPIAEQKLHQHQQEEEEQHDRQSSSNINSLDQRLDRLHLDQQQQQQQQDTPRSRSVSPAVFTSTIHGVRVNVVGVRTIKEIRHVREHEHAVSYSLGSLWCFEFSFSLPSYVHISLPPYVYNCTHTMFCGGLQTISFFFTFFLVLV